MTHHNRGFSSLIGLLLIVIVIGLGLTMYQRTAPPSEESPVSAVEEKADVPGDWIRHEDPRGFTYATPPDWYQDANSFALYPPNHVYRDLTKEKQEKGTLEVVPLAELRIPEDPSAEFMYDIAKKQWVSISCEDGNTEFYCKNARQVTRTVVESNATVGGVAAYALKHQSPQTYMVPMNSRYGLVISLTSSGTTLEELSPTLQKILGSFRFSEPTS